MILKFEEFINEELRRIKSYSSNSGSSKSYDLVYDDPTNPKSPSSGVLLRNDLQEQELQDLIDLAGEFLPKHTLKYFMKNPNKSKKLKKFLVTMNNLKFLKDRESELKELRCEYCNKGPLIIYDISTRNVTPEMLTNRNYKFNKKFDKSDGATCDHKNPQSKGGDKFDYDNLAVCCYRCNQKKGNMSYDDWMSKLNERNNIYSVVLNNIKLYEEFVGEPNINYSYIKAKMKELSEITNYTLKRNFDEGAHFDYNLTIEDLEVSLVLDREHEVEGSIALEILFNLDSLLIGFYLGHEEHFRVSSVEEGMDCIEKKIYDVLGVSESKTI